MSALEQSTITVEDLPIAVRKKRRSSAAVNSNTRNKRISSVPMASTPPATPKPTKKRVRFSDPGPEITEDYASSGLTPFIRKTHISSTSRSKRRHSTPASLSTDAHYDDTPVYGTIQFAPLRQVLDGRVKRRLRRNRLSEEWNVIEHDKRLEAKDRRSVIRKLKEQLTSKDLEVQSMRDEHDIASQLEGESGGTMATNIGLSLSLKVQELEQEILELKEKLDQTESVASEEHNWTMAARDPYDSDNDDRMITDYDNDFGDSTMLDVHTTPTRLNTSFPSPPTTMPNTPLCYPTSADTQNSNPLSDTENERIGPQLHTLQLEIAKLTQSIEFKDDNQSRLAQKLSGFIPATESHDHASLDSALDAVLTQLALSQAASLESSGKCSSLSSKINSLGFEADTPDAALALIATQFRQARLDLEYCYPGEIVEGFDNSKILEMLTSRVKKLVEILKERDESIDQYHEQELSLREQIGSRVAAMDTMRNELSIANSIVGDLRQEIGEMDIGRQRLKYALDDYRAEVAGLEKMIEKLEQQSDKKTQNLQLELSEAQARLLDEQMKHDTTRAIKEGREIIASELEQRLEAALKSAAAVQEQFINISNSTYEKDTQISILKDVIKEGDSRIKVLHLEKQDLAQQHGTALALRDARVSELRGEIERINSALRSAHATILGLRQENTSLRTEVETEKSLARSVVNSMRENMLSAMSTCLGFLNGDSPLRKHSGLHKDEGLGSSPVVPVRNSIITGGTFGDESAVRKGGLFDGRAARRTSGSGILKRRRYDSGLGFLEEAAAEEEEENIEV